MTVREHAWVENQRKSEAGWIFNGSIYGWNLFKYLPDLPKNNFARTSGQEYHEKDYYDPCLLFQVVLEETYDTFTQLYGGT